MEFNRGYEANPNPYEYAPLDGPSVVEQKRLPVEFTASGGELALLVLKNLFLGIVTLGFYAPWGRTAMRDYLWRSTQIGGVPLRYHGTGGELLRGHLIMVGLFGAMWAGLLLREPLLVVGMELVLLCLLGYVVFAGQRYRYSRTSWRGIRFGTDGDSWKWALGGPLAILATVCSFGLALPLFVALATHHLYASTRYGNEPMKDMPTLGSTIGETYLGFFLTLITGGLYASWFNAGMLRHLTKDSKLDNLRVESSLTGGDLFVMQLGFGLGMFCSLGLAYPWLRVWQLRTLAERITIVVEGEGQAHAVPHDKRGAMGDAIDADLGLDLGL